LKKPRMNTDKHGWKDNEWLTNRVEALVNVTGS